MCVITNNRESILHWLESDYKGSYRFIKDKMFCKKFGDVIYKEILEYTKFIDNTQYSFSVRVRSYIEEVNKNPTCIVCGKETIFDTNNGWQATCSRSCHIKSPDRIRKLKETNIKKYGSENYFASEEGKKRIVETNLAKYGVDNYTKSEEYKNRIKSGDIVKDNNPDSISKSNRLMYYNSLINGEYIMPLFSFDEYEGFKNRDKIYNWKCKKCGFEYESNLANQKHFICRICKPSGTKMEIFIKNFLDSKNIPFIYRDREVFDGYEIDVYIPSHKIGIELHGLYWHTENFKDKNLHKLKADLAEQRGIKLIQIFEDEFKNKLELVVSRLSNLLGLNCIKIFARKCEIKEIQNQEKSDFLKSNHIQGNSNTSMNFGLFHQNELVSVMTFSKERLALGNNKSKDDVYELNRFCSKLGINVVGGASKLLKHFINVYKPSKVISYADRRWSQGGLYEKLGFVNRGNTKPNYWYTRDFILREHRFNYRKDVLYKKIETFDPLLTESENMKNNGYLKIWDAGSKRYELTINK